MEGVQPRAAVFAILGSLLLLILWVYLPPLLRPGVPAYLRSELPAPVARDLAARGCNTVRGHGTAPGEFTASATRDWGVLCQKGDQAWLFIYTAGRGAPSILQAHPGGLAGDAEQARGIRAVGWEYAARHNPGLIVSQHPAQCLEDAMGMGSVIYCSLGGRWTALLGAD